MTNPPPPTAVPDAPVERPHRPWGWVVAVLGYLYYLTPLAVPLVNPDVRIAPGLVALVVLPGLAALVALGWRRRYPAAVAWVCAVLWAVSPSVIGAALVAQEHVARRARRRTVVAIGLAMVVAKVVGTLAEGYSPGETSAQFEWTLAAAGVVVATLLGWLRASRTAEHQRRAEAAQARAEAEAARVNEARLAERERIAREMHDVVAHRISLVALHAGALAYRATDGETGEMAGLIQSNAQAALTELRAMLTTLRGPEAPPEPPQPTLADLDALVADAAAVGQRVALERSGDPAAVPPVVSRHAYRITQEAVTNARKHAPGAPVTIDLAVTDADLRLVVRNPLADLAPRDVTGSGLGLVGVVERVEQVGGEVTHGVHGGEFVLDATLPLTPGGAA